MPQTVKQYSRASFIVLGVAVLAAAGIFILPHTAQADPHAMFYTTIGQQQLFFNVLAALDQADYVEPAQNTTGTPSGTSRQELEDKRTEAGFTPIKSDALDATKTPLASILSRGITLEGQDLWTAYIQFQLALEASRRNNVDEVFRIYCQRGLGLESCKDTAEKPKETEEQRKNAYVVDPIERSAEIYLSGVDGVLESDLDSGSYDQSERATSVEENKPRPFNKNVALLRAAAEDNVMKSAAVERVAQRIKEAVRPTGPDPATFEDIEFDPSTGTVSLKAENSSLNITSQGDEPATSYIDRYTGVLAGLLSLPVSTYSTALHGAKLIQAFQDTAEKQGAVADTYVVPNVSNNAKESIEGRIRVPAHAKIAATDTALGTLGTSESTPAYVPPQGESQHGDTQYVNRSEVEGISTGQVQGTATSDKELEVSSGEAQGRVLHAVTSDPSANPQYHDDQTSLDPATDIPVGIHHEAGAAALLRAIGYKNDRGGCGCTTESAINDHGQRIIERINNKRNE